MKTLDQAGSLTGLPYSVDHVVKMKLWKNGLAGIILQVTVILNLGVGYLSTKKSVEDISYFFSFKLKKCDKFELSVMPSYLHLILFPLF